MRQWNAQDLRRQGNAPLCAMFAARKRIFVDLLQWDLPVLAGEFEIDDFDSDGAQYLILVDEDGRHRASARLLPTERPYLLGEYFSHLSDAAPPSGPSTWEISRFCLDPAQSAADRRAARSQLIAAIVEHGLRHGITDYCGVASGGWYEQILRMGWQCELLGPPSSDHGQRVAALQIRINERTLGDLALAGSLSPQSWTLIERRIA